MSGLYSRNGQLLTLGPILGRGGEGAVHEILGQPAFVAKVYTQPVGVDKARKLEYMISQAHADVLDVAAWPVDTLHVNPHRSVQGFIMPRVNGYAEIHSLYGPAHRKKAFPHADWSFLVHTARNVASAFAAIHAHGHVIGDVNPGNVVVSQRALVQLIDCDSFQINAGGQPPFTCDVGVPQFTAPELQGRPFYQLPRTIDHDAFGLAVLCFHLLFMGRHPFAGRYHGKGDLPIEQAIRELRFAFGRHATTRQMEPPPNTLPFNILPTAITDLFERAFAPPHLSQGRPTAHDWLTALERLSRDMRICVHNRQHTYPNTAPDCLWCALERTSGTRFFLPIAAITRNERARNRTDADVLHDLWARILAITPPDDAPFPVLPTPDVEPTPLSQHIQKIRRRNQIQAALIACITGIAVFAQPSSVMMWLIGGVLVHWVMQDRAVHREWQRRRRVLLSARQERYALRARWQAAQQRFTDQLHTFARLRDEYVHLLATLQGDRERLQADQRQAQLQAFLEGYFIDAAQVPGILTTHHMALASYGIETAADVTAEALKIVPGFGQRLGYQRVEGLLNWRKALEKRFNADHTSPDTLLPAHGLTQPHHEKERAQKQRALAAAPEVLQRLKAEIDMQRAQILRELVDQSVREAQAEADVQRLYWRWYR